MKENVTVFTKSDIFRFFNLRGFWQFFKQNNSKSSHGKSELLLLSCGEYLALGTFFFFFAFSPNLKFSNYFKKRAKNLIFFQEKHIFCTFLSKIRKILNKLKNKKILDMCLYVISQKIWAF